MREVLSADYHISATSAVKTSYRRAARAGRHVYTVGDPRPNEWGPSGSWTVKGEDAILGAICTSC